jgi:hypothetical protein
VDDQIYRVLMRFHREVVIPDMQRLEDRLEDRISQRIAELRDETLTHFDAVYKRFDRLETEHHALSAAVRRREFRANVGTGFSPFREATA